MGMGISPRGGLKPEINVTPMIDVLLVLIIIFILIQPHEKGLPSEVPQNAPPEAPTKPPDKLIVLEITSGVNNRPVLRINTAQIPRETTRVEAARDLRKPSGQSAFCER